MGFYAHLILNQITGENRCKKRKLHLDPYPESM